jgi:ketosteroid isomerase-like protein
MQRGKFAVLLAVLLFSTLRLLAQESSDKARVLSLENAWNEAEVHKDAKAIAALLADTFAYTDADGEFEDKNQFLVDIKFGTSSLIVNEGMKAESYGDVIVVTGTYREQGIEKGKPYQRRGRFTDTWIRKQGQWLCAASQETLITH